MAYIVRNILFGKPSLTLEGLSCILKLKLWRTGEVKKFDGEVSMTSEKNSIAGQNLTVSVTYTRSRRAKYMRLTVRPDQTVTVTIPLRSSLDETKAFLRSKLGWIQKTLQKLRHREKDRENLDLGGVDLDEAQNDLFRRLEAFSQQHDLPYRRVAFRCQKSRWASCSGGNNINLNINLAFLPAHLQDYVLLHELAHIKVKNHSKEFWTVMDSFCGGKARQFARELRPYRMKIKP
jgi:predicted metal-dependent hydrolase